MVPSVADRWGTEQRKPSELGGSEQAASITNSGEQHRLFNYIECVALLERGG